MPAAGVALALATLGMRWPAAGPGPRVDARALELGARIGNGTYGDVHWATLGGQRVVVKASRSETEFADEYFETEAYMNSLLAGRAPESPHLAPFLGTATAEEGTKYLVWREAGRCTLREVVSKGPGAAAELARLLGVDADDRPALMRRVLRELLECLQVVHAQKVVHRDVKPENFLVDGAARSIRLIDFGSACEVGGWLHRRGYQWDRCPCSLLYAPPETFIDERAPYAFDVYSAAIVWLRCLVPPLQGETDAALSDFREELKGAGHRLDVWLRRALTEGTELASRDPRGWAEGLELFNGSFEGRLAWRLVRAMLDPEPSRRPTAGEALYGPYLGPSCGSPDQAASSAAEEACYIDDFGFPDADEAFAGGRLVEVDLSPPLGIVLEEDDDSARARRQGLARGEKATPRESRVSRSMAAARSAGGDRGVVVRALVDGGAAQRDGGVRPGDTLVAVGPFDVSELGLDEVLALLQEWGPASVHLSFRRPQGAKAAASAEEVNAA